MLPRLLWQHRLLPFLTHEVQSFEVHELMRRDRTQMAALPLSCMKATDGQ
jgi:hypothetical protein